MSMSLKQFKELCEGYGFDEIEQEADGVYCTGCMTVHKRPTKMYDNNLPGRPGRDVMCKVAIIHFYGETEAAK